jgi:AraC family transcriptional regulator of adaptative response/methylated-DNA-[protein]-cysteine methyltransferase
MLNFIEQSSMERKAAVIQKKLEARLEMGDAASIQSIIREMREYFAGTRREFGTPLATAGTSFQMRVWEELRRIPYGETIAYAELAARIGKPAAFRAVAQANSQNPLSIVIPCHRVINNDGSLGGYSSGVDRKTWLLNFEKETAGGDSGRNS